MKQQEACEDVMATSMKRRAKKAKAKAEVGNDVRWDLMATVMLELTVAGNLTPLADDEKQDAAAGAAAGQEPSPPESTAAETAIRIMKTNKKKTGATTAES